MIYIIIYNIIVLIGKQAVALRIIDKIWTSNEMRHSGDNNVNHQVLIFQTVTRFQKINLIGLAPCNLGNTCISMW